MSVPLSRPDKDRYCTKRVRDLPTWIEDLNPKLHNMIRECWNPEPTLRPSFSDLLRELAIARVIARETDKTLNLELPSSANGKSLLIDIKNYLTQLNSDGRLHERLDLPRHGTDNSETARTRAFWRRRALQPRQQFK